MKDFRWKLNFAEIFSFWITIITDTHRDTHKYTHTYTHQYTHTHTHKLINNCAIKVKSSCEAIKFCVRLT